MRTCYNTRRRIHEGWAHRAEFRQEKEVSVFIGILKVAAAMLIIGMAELICIGFFLWFVEQAGRVWRGK